MVLLLILNVNRRRYGGSSQNSRKISSGYLQQSLHPATPTPPPPLATPFPLLPEPPTPTPIPTTLITSTIPTLPPQPQRLSPLSHLSSSPNNHISKRLNLLTPYPQSLPQPLQTLPPLPHPPPRSSPRNHVPKRQNNPPKSLSQRNTHPH